jgi:hypothetical protein
LGVSMGPHLNTVSAPEDQVDSRTGRKRAKPIGKRPESWDNDQKRPKSTNTIGKQPKSPSPVRPSLRAGQIRIKHCNQYGFHTRGTTVERVLPGVLGAPSCFWEAGLAGQSLTWTQNRKLIFNAITRGSKSRTKQLQNWSTELKIDANRSGPEPGAFSRHSWGRFGPEKAPKLRRLDLNKNLKAFLTALE